ncbi:hypothetical protein BK133_26665 [Paenibacillus sp. FSL H8-0548]|uniref:tetratricopeptide repeat protein n=1 Tax=Paenibacillus sp. FSL H8-0548 TaxID=1920422 RepID=UPI00096FF6B7|nr:tetratricopeptide repeat protein [Paenibacillus sp. FSL H8-0548]OMF22377.1 hypothetical protein BK133_26665 [Paenibacillus sp. FSL H8-0548]
MIEDASSQRYERIQQLVQWKKYQDATNEAMALIRDTPEDAYAYALLGHVCLHMEQLDQALHWSEESLQRNPENELAWLVRVNAYYTKQNFKAAAEAIAEAQRIDPYEPHYFFLLANINNKVRKYAEARDLLLKALEISPENALYIANLSYNEALLLNFSESKLLASKALRLDVESDMVYMYLGWSAERRNDYEDYLLMLKNAIRLDPDDKQIRQQFLEALQKNYKWYRIMLMPGNLLKRMKTWQIIVSWIVLWILFRPFIILFIVLYILTHWTTKLLVHVKVFGWRRRG